jgi:hypothetical protein
MAHPLGFDMHRIETNPPVSAAAAGTTPQPSPPAWVPRWSRCWSTRDTPARLEALLLHLQDVAGHQHGGAARADPPVRHEDGIMMAPLPRLLIFVLGLTVLLFLINQASPSPDPSSAPEVMCHEHGSRRIMVPAGAGRSALFQSRGFRRLTRTHDLESSCYSQERSTSPVGDAVQIDLLA